MELIKSIIAIYGIIPDVFWHHFYSFVGSLLAILYHLSYDNVPPLTPIQVVTNLLGGYLVGYLLGIPLVKAEITLADAFLKEGADVALTANASHFLISLLGSSIARRYINRANKAQDSEEGKP